VSRARDPTKVNTDSPLGEGAVERQVVDSKNAKEAANYMIK